MNEIQLKLLGLRLLAQDHIKMLSSIEQSAASLTGDEHPGGHTSDWLWNVSPADTPEELIDLVNRTRK